MIQYDLDVSCTFDSIKYHPLIFDKVLLWIVIPYKFGEWFFIRGLAVKEYINLVIEDTNESTKDYD